MHAGMAIIDAFKACGNFDDLEARYSVYTGDYFPCASGPGQQEVP